MTSQYTSTVGWIILRVACYLLGANINSIKLVLSSEYIILLFPAHNWIIKTFILCLLTRISTVFKYLIASFIVAPHLDLFFVYLKHCLQCFQLSSNNLIFDYEQHEMSIIFYSTRKVSSNSSKSRAKLTNFNNNFPSLLRKTYRFHFSSTIPT